MKTKRRRGPFGKRFLALLLCMAVGGVAVPFSAYAATGGQGAGAPGSSSAASAAESAGEAPGSSAAGSSAAAGDTGGVQTPSSTAAASSQAASSQAASSQAASSQAASSQAPAQTGLPQKGLPFVPPANGAVLDAPEHRKYVTPNKDGTYKLSLDVTGGSAASEEHTPVDVVLVGDVSGSMAWYVGNTGKKRIEIAKQAAQKFAETFLTAENAKLPAAEQTRMSLVTFSDNASLKQDWTTSAPDIWGNIPDDVDGGTNWEDAFRVTNAQQARSGVQKCIVFLSDGDPTFRISDSFNTYPKMGVMGSYQSSKEITLVTAKRGGWFDDAGNKYDVSQVSYGDGLGNGNSDPFGLNFAYAVDEANWRGSNTPLFAVSTGKEAEASMSNFATQTVSKHYSGEDPASLAKAFAEIYATITRQHTYTKVSVRDTLSQYVDLMNTVNNGNVQNVEITAKDANGNPIDTTGLTKTVTYNAQTKELSWNLGDSYQLVKDATYTLSVTVRPSQKAFDEFAQSGSPHTGEAGTGDSSAGKQGFFSNDSAGLTYSIVTTSSTGDPAVSDPATAVYAKPVVQVKLNTLHIEKVWANPDYIVGYEPPATYPPVTVNVYQDGNTATPYKTVTLSEANGWKADVQVPAGPVGHVYSVSEVKVDGYTPGYNKMSTDALKPDITGAKTDTFTITNTPSTKTVYIQKLGEDGDDPDIDPDPLPGAQFKLYKDNNGTRGAEIPDAFGAENNGRFTIANLKFGAYWLEEVKAPSGYQLLPSPIRFTVDENGVALISKPGNVALGSDNLTINVTDARQYVLPATGGAGIWPFIAVAGGLVVVAVIVFVCTRRKKADGPDDSAQ